MRILVADDEKLIREVIKEYCENEGFTVDEAENGSIALELAHKNEYDLIILDIMMPVLDGFSACKEIKKEKNVPVLMLSARGEEFDKLMGFELGIDDYMTKPFSPKELVARIKAISKRYSKDVEKFVFEDLIVDFISHTVSIDDKEISLTPKEFDLLKYFIQNENVAISREILLNRIWGYDFFGDDRTIDTHVKMLRNNLGKYRDLIITVRGLGYKFVSKK